MYIKSVTILLLLTLEHCVKHVYFGLCQSTYMVRTPRTPGAGNREHPIRIRKPRTPGQELEAEDDEKFRHFVTILRRNCITDECDTEKILRKIYDKESNAN